MAVEDFYQAQWGNVRLWCSRIRTSASRAVVVLSPATGDDHFVQDHGAEPIRATCTLLFIEMPSESTGPVERLRAFKAMVAGGAEEVLIHPLDGSMLVKVDRDFAYEIDDSSNVEPVEVTFVQVRPIESVRDASAGTSVRAGSDAVAAAAEDLGTLMDVAGIDSTIATDTAAAIEAWSEADTIPTRQVLADVAATKNAIEGLIVDEGLEDDLALWDVWVGAITLLAAVRAAAIAATADSASLFFLRIAAPTSVLGLVVRVYGGADAEYYEAQVRALNDLVTVGGLLEVGTELVMPGRTAQRIGF